MFVLVVDGLACKSVYRLKRTNNDAYTRTPHSLNAACIGQSHLTHTGWDSSENVAQNCKFKFFNLFRHYVSLFNF